MNTIEAILQEIEYAVHHGWPHESLKRLENMATMARKRTALAAPSAGPVDEVELLKGWKQPSKPPTASALSLRQPGRQSMAEELTPRERKQIAEILNRRANEIAGFSDEYRRGDNHFGSVELALTREIGRLRHLAERVSPTEPDQDEDA